MDLKAVSGEGDIVPLDMDGNGLLMFIRMRY